MAVADGEKHAFASNGGVTAPDSMPWPTLLRTMLVVNRLQVRW